MSDNLKHLFVPQQDDYSCGAACLATVARLYQLAAVDYDAFRVLLDPNPETGSSALKMAEVSRGYLPVESLGEDSYNGGVAIANITEDEGHYVVFLCRKGDRVIYYDPYEHEVLVKDIDQINWMSDPSWTSKTGYHLRRWSINFAPLPDNSFERWESLLKPAPAPPAPNRYGPPPSSA